MESEQLAADLRKAIGAHGAWKLRLKTAVTIGKSPITAQDAANCTACDFGHWLTDAFRGGSLAGEVQHRVVSRIHAEFHAAAGEVIGCVERGDLARAHHLLETSFTERSEHLVNGLNKWITEARKKQAA